MNRTCAVSEVNPGEIFTAVFGGTAKGVFIKTGDIYVTAINTGNWHLVPIDPGKIVEVIGKVGVEKYEQKYKFVIHRNEVDTEIHCFSDKDELIAKYYNRNCETWTDSQIEEYYTNWLNNREKK